MAPTVGRHKDGSTLAIGSPGADRITTALVQVLAGYVNGGMSLEQAVSHPRVHVRRAGRPEEQVQLETDLTMYFGGVAAARAARDAAAALGHAGGRGGRRALASVSSGTFPHRASDPRQRRRRALSALGNHELMPRSGAGRWPLPCSHGPPPLLI